MQIRMPIYTFPVYEKKRRERAHILSFLIIKQKNRVIEPPSFDAGQKIEKMTTFLLSIIVCLLFLAYSSPCIETTKGNLDCSNKGLFSFPSCRKTVTMDIKKIYIQNNNLKTLNFPNIQSCFPELEYIDLRDQKGTLEPFICPGNIFIRFNCQNMAVEDYFRSNICSRSGIENEIYCCCEKKIFNISTNNNIKLTVKPEKSPEIKNTKMETKHSTYYHLIPAILLPFILVLISGILYRRYSHRGRMEIPPTTLPINCLGAENLNNRINNREESNNNDDDNNSDIIFDAIAHRNTYQINTLSIRSLDTWPIDEHNNGIQVSVV